MTKSIGPATQSLVAALVAPASIVHSLIIWIAGFVLAVVATLMFYLTALKRGAVDAGALAKTDTLINSLNFTEFDYSTFNGCSGLFMTLGSFESALSLVESSVDFLDHLQC